MAADLFKAIGFLKAEVEPLLRRFTRTNPDVHYCDLRFEVIVARTASAEEGSPRSARERNEATLGVTVHCAEAGGVGFGHSGVGIGSIALRHHALIRTLKAALAEAYERARLSAREHARLLKEAGSRTPTLQYSPLPPRPAIRDDMRGTFTRDPREVSTQELARLAQEASRAAAGVGKGIVFDHVSALTELREELFASSEGSLITQQFAFSQGDCFVVAQSGDGHQENYDTIGQQRGLECLSEGWRTEPLSNADLLSFAADLAKESKELAAAPPLNPPEAEVTVVTDPHFNALLVHEIVGHPCEADRALKMEAAYAGRSWLLRSLEDNEVGRQIGSPLLSASSDPGLLGYGHYRYDHEGTFGARVAHIEQGVFRGFLNSRATAQVLGAAPNGSARASEARLAPLIRMSNTFFLPGESDSARIIGEVDRGYYVCGNLIPSIAESRENFRISARRVYEIDHGRLGRLFRAGSVISDSRQFFMNIDAVGNDLRLFAIPNCGKGQPMQAKRMSNGGPTLRSRARLGGSG